MFKTRYDREFKRDVDDMKDFIEKYELGSQRIKKLYPDVTLEIAHVTSAYDNVIPIKKGPYFSLKRNDKFRDLDNVVRLQLNIITFDCLLYLSST
jgi:hypothetical protein